MSTQALTYNLYRRRLAFERLSGVFSASAHEVPAKLGAFSVFQSEIIFGRSYQCLSRC